MTALSPTLQLACELIERPSVTPADADCQTIMMARLSAIGFECQSLRFGDVDNFWAVHGTSAVSYTQLTLPTICCVEIWEVVVFSKKNLLN